VLKNTSKYITTKGHLEWDGKQYRYVSDEGYWYDGPLTLASGVPTRETGSWNFYTDGTETGALVFNSAPNNTNPSLEVDTIYHFRIVFEETIGAKWNNPHFSLQYSHQGGTWTPVTATSSVIQVDSNSGLVDGADTSERISGTQSFQAWAGQDDVDGQILDSLDINAETCNAVFGFKIISADVANGETIALRLWDENVGDTLDNNQQADAVITVNVPVLPVFVQGHHRWENDDGTIGTSSFIANEDIDIVQDADTSFRLRMNFGESAGQTEGIGFNVKLEFDVNDSGTWTQVGAATAVKYITSAYEVDQQTQSNERLTTPPTGCLTYDNSRYDDNNVVADKIFSDEYGEVIHNIQLDSAQLSHDDVVTFKYTDGNEVFTTVNTTPSLTVNIPDNTQTISDVPFISSTSQTFLPTVEIPPYWVSGHFRAEYDNGSLDTSTFILIEDSNPGVYANNNFRIRFGWGESNKQQTSRPLRVKLQAKPGGGEWSDVTDSTPIQFVLSAYATDGVVSTTERLDTPPTGCNEHNLTEFQSAGTTMPFQLSDTYGETVFNLVADLAQTGNYQTFNLRIVDGDDNEVFTTEDSLPALLVMHSVKIDDTDFISSSSQTFAPSLVIVDFYAEVQTVDTITPNQVWCDADFEVDWGDGIWLPYATGYSASVVSSTGLIKFRSVNSPTSIALMTDTFTGIDIQLSDTITSLSSSFLDCTNLTSFAMDDASNLENLGDAWRGCSGLIDFPLIDTSNVEAFSRAWRDCTSLTTLPALDYSSGLFFVATWRGCTNLVSLPALNTVIGTSFSNTFLDCTNLVCLTAIDTTAQTGTADMFLGCTSLLHPTPAEIADLLDPGDNYVNELTCPADYITIEYISSSSSLFTPSVVDPLAAVSLARYLLNEAPSGTGVTTIIDDTGNGNDLTNVGYGTSAMQWENVPAGNGLVSNSDTHDGIAELANISDNGTIGSSLGTTGKLSFIVRANLLSGSANINRVFLIGANNYGDIALCLSATEIIIRFDAAEPSSAYYTKTLPTGLHTFAVIIDSSELSQNDRCRLYIDGVLETPASNSIVLDNEVNYNVSTNSMVLLNRPDASRGGHAELYYAELFKGLLTEQQAIDSHNALSSNNDEDWDSDTQYISAPFITSGNSLFVPIIGIKPKLSTPTPNSPKFEGDILGLLEGPWHGWIVDNPTSYDSIGDTPSNLSVSELGDYITQLTGTLAVGSAGTYSIQFSVTNPYGTTVTNPFDFVVQKKLSADFVSSTSQTFEASAIPSTVTISDLGFISSTSETYEPVLNSIATLDIGFIPLSSTTYTVNVISIYNLDLDFISTGFTVYDSTLSSSKTIEDVDFIPSSSQTFLPSLVIFDFFASAQSLGSLPLCTVYASHDYQVDWGDGVWTPHTGGVNATDTALGTGEIRVRSSNSPTQFKLITNTFTALDLSQSSTITNMELICNGMNNLTSFAMDDASNVTSLSVAFNGCSELISFPLIDTSKVTNFNYAWGYCDKLASFPAIDMTSAETLASTWRSNGALTSFPAIDTTGATDFSSTFRDCTNLTCLKTLDTTSQTAIVNLFLGCTSLLNPTPGEIELLTGVGGYDYVNENSCPDTNGYIYQQFIPSTSQTFLPDLTGTYTINDIDFISSTIQTYQFDISGTYTIEDVDFISGTSQTFIPTVSTAGITNPLWVQGHFRFENDDGTLETSTFIHDEDTSNNVNNI